MESSAPVRNEEVLARVRELLGKYPELTSRQLFDLAIRMEPSLEEGGIRSFHARYVLPIRREKAAAEGRIRPRKKAPKEPKEPKNATSAKSGRKRTEADDHVVTDAAAARGRIRGVLLRFARQIAGSKTRGDLVDALANVDNLVDEIAPEIAATRRP